MELTDHIYLEEFRSSYNNIASISPNIGNSIKLKHLDLYACPIKEIPKDIGKLISLRYFYFNGNVGGGIIDAHVIPKNIMKCIHLKCISGLYNNKDLTLERFMKHINYRKNKNKEDLLFNDSNKDSIINLLNDIKYISYKQLEADINNNDIINKELILKLLKNEAYHKQYFCTFKELFLKVYQRIINHPQKNKLFEKLNKELSYPNVNLSTDCLLQLANVLSGSYDDIKIDINIDINIDISNKYEYIENKIKNELII
jgi:hypothetical protein